MGEMKKRLSAQQKESQQLLTELSARNASTKQLQTQLQRELKTAQKMRASLDAQQQSFAAQKAELASMLQSMQSVPDSVRKGQGLVDELSAFFAETRSVEAELDKLKALRIRQEEMVTQCKVNIETINSRQQEFPDITVQDDGEKKRGRLFSVCSQKTLKTVSRNLKTDS